MTQKQPGVLGTIADEIQLQQGTFLEFISDEVCFFGEECWAVAQTLEEMSEWRR